MFFFKVEKDDGKTIIINYKVKKIYFVQITCKAQNTLYYK